VLRLVGSIEALVQAEFSAGLLTVGRDGEPGTRAVAVDTLGSAKARWWLAVDEALREQWWSAPRWSRSLAADLADGEVELLHLVIAGCHRDGRIREAAVAHLADHAHPAALAVLTLRTLDWVAEVRQRARRAVEGRLSSSQGSLTQLVRSGR
jgi:hypothetical protein